MSEYSVDLKDLTQDRILSKEPRARCLDLRQPIFASRPLVWSAHVESCRRGNPDHRIIDGRRGWSCSRCLEPAQCGISRSFTFSSDSAMKEFFDEECRAAQGCCVAPAKDRFDNDATYTGVRDPGRTN